MLVFGHPDLSKDVGVVDRGDGTYRYTYFVAAGVQGQTALLDV